MQLILKNNLLFTQLTIAYQGKSIEIADILILGGKNVLF